MKTRKRQPETWASSFHREIIRPTLLVWGEQDAIVPASTGQEYHRRIPGSRLEIIENCGHHPELEATDRFVRLVEGVFG